VRLLRVFSLRIFSDPQTISMPRRARIVHVYVSRVDVQLFAEVEEDADTKAFDTGKHLRTFIVLNGGAPVPEGAGFIGADGRCLVYETKAG